MSKRYVVDKSPIVVTRTSALIDDALLIIQTQLNYYLKKSKAGVTLDLKQARILQNYMDVLVKLSREERERERHEDPSKLSDEELLSLVNDLIKNKQLEEPKSDSEKGE